MISYISGRWWRWKFWNVLLVVLLQVCLETSVLSCQVDCNQVLSSPQGSFTSPCYPSDYPKSLACKWTLQAPAGFIVQLTFADFELEEALGCVYDRVIVSTGSNDVKFCGITAHGLTLNSTGNVMEFSFHSDFSIQKKGFNVTYRQVAVALRNQKVRIPQGNGQMVQVSSLVTIPSLEKFTVCFEIAREREQSDEKIFSYVSGGSDILVFGMSGSEMTLSINSVQCGLGTILNQSDFTSDMKSFCFTWTSTSGRVTMYANGYRTTSCTDSKHQTLNGGGTFSLGGGRDSFDGDVYNFRLWDYAMTRSQLTDLTCDVVGNIIDWGNSFWDIPVSHAQTDSSLSCICFPNCTHLTTAVPSSGTAMPTLTSPTTSCASSGMGCPAPILTSATASTVTTNMADTNPTRNVQSTTTSPAITTSMPLSSTSTDVNGTAALWLMLRLREAAVDLSTHPHSRAHVIAGPKSSKTSLGMISTPLIWPARKKPDSLAQPLEKPVYPTKPPIRPIMGVTNTSAKTKVAATLSDSMKTNPVSNDTIHLEEALTWQPEGTRNGSEDVEHFEVASLSNRKNKPLAPHWALMVSTEDMNWTESLEYSSGMEPFIYDIELGEEPFSHYDFELPYSLDDSFAVDDAHLADTFSAMGIDEDSLDPGDIEKPLSDLPGPHLNWDLQAGDSARRPPRGWKPIRPFDRKPGGTGVRTDPSGPSSISTPTPETSAHVQHWPSPYQTFGPWTQSVPSRPTMFDNYKELSTTSVETGTQTEVPLASSSESQLPEHAAVPAEYLESSLLSSKKPSSSAVSEVASPFSHISGSEKEGAPLSDSHHVQASQTNTPHLRSSEAILMPAIKIQSDLLITEAPSLHPLSLSRLSDFFLPFTHGSAEIRHSSSHKDYEGPVLLSVTEQFTSTVRPHFKDSKSALPVDTMPSAQGGKTAVIMSATSGGSRLGSSVVLEQSPVNGTQKTLLNYLKGHYSSPSDSDMMWLTHSDHIAVSDITKVLHKATAAVGDKLPVFQSSSFIAISKTREGQNYILPTFSIPPHLSETGFPRESLFSELVDNASVTAVEGNYLTEAQVNVSLLNGSQWGSLSQAHLLQPSYSGTVASQAESTWQGTSQAHDDDVTYLSETKRLPSLLNPSPTPLKLHHVSLSEHSEVFSHEPLGSAHMTSINMTSSYHLLGSATHLSSRDFLSEPHLVTSPPHSDEDRPVSHPTPPLEVTSAFGAQDEVGGSTGAIQPNQPMEAFLHTSVQGTAQPTGPHEEPFRPTALLETGPAPQLELHLNVSEPFSDGKPKEGTQNDQLVLTSSHPFFAVDSSSSTVTWKNSTVAQTTPSHPEAHQSHSSHTAATDQSFVPTKGPIPLFTPPRGVNAANASQPTRATSGISSAIPELTMCQCKAPFHISCLCGLSTGNKGLFYKLSFVVNDNQANYAEMEVNRTVSLWLEQTFKNWTYNVYVADVRIQPSNGDSSATKRYTCQALLVYRYTTESQLEEAAIQGRLLKKKQSIQSGLLIDAITVQAVGNCEAEENPAHYNWPESRPTVTQFVPCFPNKALIASRTCTLNWQNYTSFWDSPDFTNCTDIDGIEVSAENAADVVTQLADITQKELSTNEVSKVVTKLKEVVNVAKINAPLASSMVAVFSNVMTSSDTALAATSELTLKTVDEMVQKIVFDGSSLSITSENLALGISSLNTSEYNGTSFSAFLHPNTTDVQIDFESEQRNPLAAVTLPATLLSNLSDADMDSSFRIHFMFFSKTGLFQDQTSNGLNLRSYVVASSVGNQTIRNLQDPVQIEIVHLQKQSNPKPVCVFWDFSIKNGTGGWNSDGCTVSPESNEYKTICLCNHLTHFGILMDISGSAERIDAQNTKILTFITYIGCGISAIFSAATLLTYIAFEKLRRDYPSKILMNLSTSLLLLNMVFLLDGWLASFDMDGLCIAVAVFLHYFLLTSFTWMGLESVHMYIALVKVFNTYIRRYILKFCIVGWGLPATIIAIVVAIDRKFYGKEYYGKDENGQGSSEFCWIRSQLVFYLTCVTYFCIIFLLNVAMFIVVMMQICGRNGKRSNRTLREEVLRNLRSVVSLTFLLGMTWGFAFFAWGPVNLAFMYLFAIFNSLQGLFIFIFHCAMKENVQKQWRRYLCCGKFRLAENSDWSKTATNNTKKVSSDNIGKSLSSSSFGSSTANWTSKAKATLNPFAKRSSNTGKGYAGQTSPKFSPADGDGTSSIIPVHQVIDKVKGYCSVRSDNFYKNIIMSDSFSHSTKF